MPSQFFVPGPAHVAIGLGLNRALIYAGLSRRGFSVSENQFERTVQCDATGSGGMPGDVILLGKMLTVTGQMVWTSQLVIDLLRARFFGGLPGQIQAGEIGALVNTEGLGFQIQILSQYPNIKSVYSTFAPGLRIFNGYVSRNLEANYATEEQAHNVVFTGLYPMDFSTGTGTGWDYDTSQFPAIS